MLDLSFKIGGYFPESRKLEKIEIAGHFCAETFADKTGVSYSEEKYSRGLKQIYTYICDFSNMHEFPRHTLYRNPCGGFQLCASTRTVSSSSFCFLRGKSFIILLWNTRTHTHTRARARARVCQYIAIANKTREKWSIAASTVSWTLDRPVAKYCMKLIHGAAWFIVHARPSRIN